MRLTQLTSLIPGATHTGSDVELAQVDYDSRKVTPGALFVALHGEKSDGHDFIEAALAAGASAVAVDASRAADPRWAGAPRLIVQNTRQALPRIAAALYGEPSRALDLIGVTGTNGKTSATFMIDSILRAAGRRTGVIGTIGALVDGRPVPQDRTTPESADLQKLFAEMRGAGVNAVTMEVSSEGILAGRTRECAFRTGVFTNLTQDHLNRHGTMEAYFNEKLRLFTEYPAAFPDIPFNAVVNGDDAYGRAVIQDARKAGHRVLIYGIDAADAELTATIDEVRPDSVRFTARHEDIVIPIKLRFSGLFNVLNALASIGAGLLRGISPDTIRAGLEGLTGVPGRFELIDTGGRGFHVVVDYAHTPDGLENVLRSARALNPARLICVFGCGGDRDRPKRPLMGGISHDLADITIVTSDNPRTEDPRAIVDAILTGIDADRRHEVFVEVDRAAAIKQALCEIARPGDLVVIAGKGHESEQQFADHKIHFDDREVAREALAGCA